MKVVAFPLPVSMQDDEPMLRAVLTRVAEREGVTVPSDAPITTRIVTDRFDPDLQALLAEAEASER